MFKSLTVLFCAYVLCFHFQDCLSMKLFIQASSGSTQNSVLGVITLRGKVHIQNVCLKCWHTQNNLIIHYDSSIKEHISIFQSLNTYTMPGAGQCEPVFTALTILLDGIWKSTKLKQHLSGTAEASSVGEIKTSFRREWV